jgi:hypothetical protein
MAPSVDQQAIRNQLLFNRRKLSTDLPPNLGISLGFRALLFC